MNSNQRGERCSDCGFLFMAEEDVIYNAQTDEYSHCYADRCVSNLSGEVDRLRSLMADCAESLRIATTFHYDRDDAERMDAIITRMSDEVGEVINRLDPIDGPSDVAPAVPDCCTQDGSHDFGCPNANRRAAETAAERKP